MHSSSRTGTTIVWDSPPLQTDFGFRPLATRGISGDTSVEAEVSHNKSSTSLLHTGTPLKRWVGTLAVRGKLDRTSDW